MTKHLAILSNKTPFLERIQNGQKTIETRWYSHRVAPWDKIHKNDLVYFRNSGEKEVKLQASVEKVEQISELTPQKIYSTLETFWQKIGLKYEEIDDFFKQIRNKKYVILIYLCEVKEIKPIQIEKKGVGMQSAWCLVE